MPFRALKSPPWFLAGCLAEFSLLLLALLLGWIFTEPVLATLNWNGEAVRWGIAGIGPMGILFVWILRSAWQPLAHIRAILDQIVRPVLERWSWYHLLAISVIAGFSEEALFRGLLQGTLTSWLGPWGALAVASVVFGLCHYLSTVYALLAAVIGAWLGWLWWHTGNLAAPIIAHALYDFLALVYFLRVGEKPAPPGGSETQDEP